MSPINPEKLQPFDDLSSEEIALNELNRELYQHDSEFLERARRANEGEIFKHASVLLRGLMVCRITTTKNGESQVFTQPFVNLKRKDDHILSSGRIYMVAADGSLYFFKKDGSEVACLSREDKNRSRYPLLKGFEVGQKRGQRSKMIPVDEEIEIPTGGRMKIEIIDLGDRDNAGGIERSITEAKRVEAEMRETLAKAKELVTGETLPL